MPKKRKPKQPPRKMIKCFQCDYQTDNVDEYRKHRMEHREGAIANKVARKPDRLGPVEVPVEMREDLDLRRKEKKPEKLKEAPKKASTSSVKPSPRLPQPPGSVKLEYKYVGNCNCGGELNTVVLDDVAPSKSDVVVIGLCKSCDKKMRQRVVAKL